MKNAGCEAELEKTKHELQETCLLYTSEYDEKNTSLPETPDYQRINEFRMFVNEKVVTGKIEKEN